MIRALPLAVLAVFSIPTLRAEPKDWEPAIRAFESHDKESPPPEKPILFLGSSSTRMWDLKKSFPDFSTLNRGFGGSELSDTLRYFDRIVLPYRPRAILLYAGDNDIAIGETAAQVVADYKAFAAKVRSKLPDAHFAYLPIKPSLQRWDKWPEMKNANEAIRALTEADSHLHYLDTATPMLGEDGKPKPGLFLDDGLHLNQAGYELWNTIVEPWLKEGLRPAAP
jgi:lysophospholipase L1-like esterase